jgi:uncharacterized membrane protein (Fun14 family)
MYFRHILISFLSLILGLFLIKYINNLWYSNIDLLKPIANNGFRELFFHNGIAFLGGIIGLINGIGLGFKWELIILKFFIGPFILCLVIGTQYGISFISYFLLSMLLASIGSMVISKALRYKDPHIEA